MTPPASFDPVAEWPYVVPGSEGDERDNTDETSDVRSCRRGRVEREESTRDEGECGEQRSAAEKGNGLGVARHDRIRGSYKAVAECDPPYQAHGRHHHDGGEHERQHNHDFNLTPFDCHDFDRPLTGEKSILHVRVRPFAVAADRDDVELRKPVADHGRDRLVPDTRKYVSARKPPLAVEDDVRRVSDPSGTYEVVDDPIAQSGAGGSGL